MEKNNEKNNGSIQEMRAIGEADDNHVRASRSVSQEQIVVSFDPNDPTNPHNWSPIKRACIVVTSVVLCFNSTMASALTSNLVPYFQKDFGVPDGPQNVLPASVYLLGFVFGPLIFGPMSESHGRKPIILVGFTGFFLSLVASALAPNWVSFLVFRFLCGTFGSPPTSVAGGLLADIFEDPVARGRTLSAWSAATFIGPLGAPILAGFGGPVLGWRWVFWIAVIFAAASAVLLLFLPETFALKILETKAAKLNKREGYQRYITPVDKMGRQSFLSSLGVTLSRPFVLLFNEMILMLSCLYLAFVYSVFYMMLAIYPAIFNGVYGLSRGVVGCIFLFMAVGAIAACVTFIWYDGVAPKLVAKHPSRRAEFLRLPIACAGGPCFVIAMFWLGWTSKTDIPWIVPALASIPYGYAFQMIFMSMTNYITDAYGVYAASALAGLQAVRAIVGAVLPLASQTMLNSLGIAWACTVLGFISVALSLVPFGFLAYGQQIRAASKYSNKLQSPEEPQAGDLMRTVSQV